MPFSENPAAVAVEAQLRVLVRRGEYGAVVTFLDEPERYADVPPELKCCLERAMCQLLADECQRRPGEPLEAQQQRVKKIVQAGAVELASSASLANAGCCHAATAAACRLITAVTAHAVISPATMQRCVDVNVASDMLRVLVINPDALH